MEDLKTAKLNMADLNGADLKIENLKYRRDDFTLRVDHLTSQTGERTALMGLNGSGKSTFFHLLTGLLPYEGSIQVGGQEIKKMPSALLGRKVSLCFQNPDHNLITSTVREEILFASRNYYPEISASAVIDYVLEHFPIEHLLKKSTQDLSYGEKRLVSLAVCIAHKPDVILLDEPFTMLDYKQKNNLQKFVQAMPAKVIFIATHETELIEDICKRVCVFTNGQLNIDQSYDWIKNH